MKRLTAPLIIIIFRAPRPGACRRPIGDTSRTRPSCGFLSSITRTPTTGGAGFARGLYSPGSLPCSSRGHLVSSLPLAKYSRWESPRRSVSLCSLCCRAEGLGGSPRQARRPWSTESGSPSPHTPYLWPSAQSETVDAYMHTDVLPAVPSDYNFAKGAACR